MGGDSLCWGGRAERDLKATDLFLTRVGCGGSEEAGEDLIEVNGLSRDEVGPFRRRELGTVCRIEDGGDSELDVVGEILKRSPGLL
jgi:hypothetical protein